MCGSMVDILSAAAEIRRGKKKDRRKKERNHRAKISWRALLHRAAINSTNIKSMPVGLEKLKLTFNPFLYRKTPNFATKWDLLFRQKPHNCESLVCKQPLIDTVGSHNESCRE